MLGNKRMTLTFHCAENVEGFKHDVSNTTVRQVNFVVNTRK